MLDFLILLLFAANFATAVLRYCQHGSIGYLGLAVLLGIMAMVFIIAMVQTRWRGWRTQRRLRKTLRGHKE